MDALVPLLLDLQAELAREGGGQALLFSLLPAFLLFEVPLNLLVVLGVLRWFTRQRFQRPSAGSYQPRVSCIITCYSEGLDVRKRPGHR